MISPFPLSCTSNNAVTYLVYFGGKKDLNSRRSILKCNSEPRNKLLRIELGESIQSIFLLMEEKVNKEQYLSLAFALGKQRSQW